MKTTVLKILIVSLVVAIFGLKVMAQPTQSVVALLDSVQSNSKNDLEISLITCYPGPEVYELYGHSAVRVKGVDFDYAYNYGVFDFSEPNFVYRFVKGETDYMATKQSFEDFIRQYEWRGSKVVAQKLNLSNVEAKSLFVELEKDVLPENSVYRYNYVKNNCATKILDCIERISSIKPIYTDTVRYGTFRNEMRYYNRNYDWYQFGIDLALGAGIDYNLTSREEMFVPVVMMENMKTAKLADSRTLVKSEEVIYAGRGDMTLSATPLLLSPLFLSWLILALILLFIYWSIRKMRMVKWIYAVWFTICGLAGSLITFLVFVSQHEATSPNVLIWWLNPLCFIVPLLIWVKKTNLVMMIYMLLNASLLVGLMIGMIFGSQSLNPAFIPLMLITLTLSVTYFVVNARTEHPIVIKLDKK